MKHLIRAEWQRLWNQKITWISLFSIPIILIFAARIYQQRNNLLPIDDLNYTYANNFPIFSISAHFTITLNVIIILMVVLHIAHEYYSGQMRFILQRPATFPQIILGKWVTIILFLALYLFIYFVMSLVIGFLIFDIQSQITLLNERYGFGEVIVYSSLYYILMYFTLVAMTSVMINLSLLSKSTTGAVVLCVSFLLFLFIYPNIILSFFNSPLAGAFIYSSLVLIQFQGIDFILFGEFQAKFILISVVLISLFVSSFITNYLVRNKEHYI